MESIDIPATCPVFGLPLEVGGGDAAPSLDRIDPDAGYTDENTVVVSWRANRMKGQASVSDLLRMAAFYIKLKGKRMDGFTLFMLMLLSFTLGVVAGIFAEREGE